MKTTEEIFEELKGIMIKYGNLCSELCELEDSSVSVRAKYEEKADWVSLNKMFDEWEKTKEAQALDKCISRVTVD